MVKMLRHVLPSAALLAAAAAGCTPKQYAAQADRAAYGAISQAQEVVLGSNPGLDVAYRPFCDDPDSKEPEIRVGNKVILLRGGRPAALTGDDYRRIVAGIRGEIQRLPGRPTLRQYRQIVVRQWRAYERPPATLTLDDGLEIAFRNSRTFQTRKETLYSLALSLANERRAWNFTLLTGDAAADISHSRVGNDPSSESSAATGEAGLNWTQKFFDGGALALAATIDFATDFFDAGGTPIGSLLSANFTQPLLRGAWRGFAYEDQYRLERNFLISVFEYERFTQTFAVGILAAYYNVLSQRDQLENEAQNIQRVQDTVEVTKWLVQGGHNPPTDADEAEQDLINAKVRFEQRRQSYEDALDAFKVRIGLPITARVRVDYPNALRELNKIGPLPVPFQEEEATKIALTTRPDVLTRRAAVRDAARDAAIAADNFLPRLDLALGISAPGTGTQKFHRIEFDRHTRTAQLEFQYELDQTANRNAYRNAIIALEKAKRGYEQFLDETVRLGVRQSYRNLLQSRTSYELQKQNVAIAIRRRAMVILEQRRGRAATDDVLRAEESLRNAQNGLTSALISYTTTRLEFLADLGMIQVNERGQIHEREEPFRFERIARRYPHVGADGRALCEAFDGGK